MISARAIAVQGLGFSPLLIAVQGFLPADEQSNRAARHNSFIVSVGRMMSR
jgi:hypothetical protein